MENQILLRMNEDGVFEEYKEPFATIECPTEEDYQYLKEAVQEKHEREKGCDWCTGVAKNFPTHCDGMAEITRLIPLPAIDLTTGETADSSDPPFFAIRIQSDDMGEDFVPIRFCPKCGRELKEG